MYDNLSLTPAGHLVMLSGAPGDSGLLFDVDAVPLRAEKIVAAFAASPEEGLLALAGAKPDPSWPRSWAYWRDFAAQYLTALCQAPLSTQDLEPLSPPQAGDLERLALAIPPMTGAEYCTPAVLAAIWAELDAWARGAIRRYHDGLAGFLREHAPLWRQVGRVCFHLAENKADPEMPFAFLATYVPRLGRNARVQHQPLSQALIEYAGRRNKEALIRLLEPVHLAGTKCAWVQELVESSDIYHPLAWTPAEAYAFLESVPILETSGLVVRLPDWWKKRVRPKVQVQIGNVKGSSLGAKTLLDFQVQLTLAGEPLTNEEIETLLAAGDGLKLLRGQWIEVDSEKLRQALAHWREIEAETAGAGLSFFEGMRLMAGARRDLSGEAEGETEKDWAYVEAGAWLREVLNGLRAPQSLAAAAPGPRLTAALRPYQEIGVNWLFFLTELGLGACLADDMGLGKTIQVIALLLRQSQKNDRPPSLLVLPASLLSNWKGEIERFAPTLKTVILHPAETSKTELDRIAHSPVPGLAGVDAVFTTYGMLTRQEWLKTITWNLIVCDEAQAIKNPGTRQTKAVKALKGRARLALTGTPVENRLGDLWSLFDFLCPGLLGSSSRFKRFVKALGEQEGASYAPLRRLVQPYILRRMKSDRSVIADLPDKTEMTAWCGLTKAQAALYQQAVEALAEAIDSQIEGIKRRGLILSFLLRFKQICNHPSQATGDGDYTAEKSGKFGRLREITEEIASRQEKVLVFTQFKEMTGPLATFLAEVFGRPGLILHGSTPVKERPLLVERFQQEQGPPFFVLSLKAAGIGLNLTAASHVIHFDRWWNPAVENQATDRAFRIGQKQNVLVHKFVCQGTVEEKIDAMIKEKTKLAADLLEGGSETLLTEMDDEALLRMVSLDLEKSSL